MSAKTIRITVLALLGLSPPAWAYDCSIGGEEVTTSVDLSFGADASGRAVWLEASTSRSVSDTEHCPGWVRVEGWITGDPSGATSHQAPTVASLGYPSDIGAMMMIDCTPDTYTGNSKHWFIENGWFGDPWHHILDDADHESVPGCIGGGGAGHVPTQCNADTDECWDPVLLDTAGNGFELTDPASGVLFDLNGDGTPELIAWTAGGGDDGWLVMDRNGDGIINDGTELFSNFTPAYADKPLPTARNGFVALSFLENPSYGLSNGDGILDQHDAAYSRLMIWIDVNHNGVSEVTELRSAADHGLVALDTAYKEKKRKRDKHGNAFLQRGISWWVDAGGTIKRRDFYDVWLKH